ncbi:MAG: hypothetical protein COS98_02035 [Parcubacteria group bacterium CG07_land_8_20_14_0_80_35_11]|nr:MAG: hypothetical protein COS98_02035 [Parcubacteria group bacterium CG07_land_8_20_14_0_80_35_11]
MPRIKTLWSAQRERVKSFKGRYFYVPSRLFGTPLGTATNIIFDILEVTELIQNFQKKKMTLKDRNKLVSLVWDTPMNSNVRKSIGSVEESVIGKLRREIDEPIDRKFDRKINRKIRKLVG